MNMAFCLRIYNLSVNLPFGQEYTFISELSWWKRVKRTGPYKNQIHSLDLISMFQPSELIGRDPGKHFPSEL